MAFTHKFKSARPPHGDVVNYNVDYSVGLGGTNGREDVMLVQAMMRMFYWEITDVGQVDHPGELDPPPGQTQIIKVDGWYGPVTQKYIDYFQQRQATYNGQTLTDGVLDPYRAESGLPSYSHVSKTIYAMGSLVAKCANYCRDGGETWWADLPNRVDADTPVQLSNSLKLVKSKPNKYRYG